MGISDKLINVQSKLIAPKSQYNSFGKYNFRNCEDILEAVKPLLLENKLTLVLTDKVVLIGDRYYVEATAILRDIETSEKIEVNAYAREEENKKGMDGSQVTGASSSYARKYALNGLFCIDDTKDSDTTNKNTSKSSNKVTEAQIKRLYTISNKAGYNSDKLKEFVFKKYEKKIEELTKDEYNYICSKLEVK